MTAWRVDERLQRLRTELDDHTRIAEQYRLSERFAEILGEAADYSRLVQTQESQQIAGALGVLTILGLPLSTALSILQVMGDEDPVHLLIAVATAFAATVGGLTTHYGRLVLSSLRGGRGR
ncbi:hypothetical protein [Streptomyces sp. MNP-20]|uniref:hypothetical protein n=1 Tax=Streptomyces sp. MNP-20 TaxID=2721165 RepID=UPI0020A6ABE1|nr:hypothetical protein [Streptomyces sp. MNP-20]